MNSGNKVINFWKMIFFPLIITFISILGIGLMSSWIGSRIIVENARAFGLDIAKEMANQIESNSISLTTIDEIIEDKIIVVGKAIILSNQKPSNNLLKYMVKKFDVYEINLFNRKGEVICSNIEEYVGVKVAPDHPVNIFINSGLDFSVEKNIRKDTKSERFLRYGYIKNRDGSVIQIGILAEEIKKLRDKFEYQNQLNRYKNNNKVVFAVFYDNTLKEMARIENISISDIDNVHNTLLKALNNEASLVELKDTLSGKRLMKVTVPVMNKGKVIGVLSLGISLDSTYKILIWYMTASIFIGIILCLVIFICLNKRIKIPVEKFSRDILKINVEADLEYRLPIEKDDSFYGLKVIANKILDKISVYFKELKENQEELSAANEELTATIEQLTAAEEELKAQYDEIQNYSEKLEELKQRYDIAVKSSNSGVWELDLYDKTIELSENLMDLMGYKINKYGKIDEVLDNFLSKEDKELLIKNYWDYQYGEKEYIHSQVSVVDKDGKKRWFLVTGKGIKDGSGKLKRLYGLFIETTEIKEKEKEIEYMALHDQLTGLPNRTQFIRELTQELNSLRKGAVMLLDIDNFKNINDIMGHIYGDKLLIKVADAFKQLSDEKLQFFRFGGDEFLILIKCEEDKDLIEEYALKILKVFKEEINYSIDDINITASIGIVLYPEDDYLIEGLLMKADTAMYRAKYAGKNKHMFFHPNMTAKLKENIEIEGALRKALENEGFILLYQPVVDAKTKEIVCLEALLRLKDYFYSPAKFIPIAEETNLIIPIGKWVINETVRQIKIWKERGIEVKPIAINVSPKQIHDNTFIDTVKKTLDEYGVEPQLLEIEITESIMLERKEEIIKKLEELKKIGVTLALDDFGTGYSSLNYLTYLNVDKVKLDKSLGDKFLEKENIKVMESIISLIQSLKLKVTAEGIENMEQFNALKEIQCDFIQGYVISKPLPVYEIEELLYKNYLK